MSEKDPAATKQWDEISPEAVSKLRGKIFGNLVEQLKPWLFEFGNWIFGGLIAFSLVIVATLLTVGPIHPAILVSMATFACALPLDVLGVFLLKLIRDMNGVGIDDVMKQAFQDIPTPNSHFPEPEESESRSKLRTDVGLRYSVRLAVLCAALSMFGVVAALWYMAWWVAAIFFVMVIVSLLLTVTMLPGLVRPASDSEKALWQRVREQREQKRMAK